MQSKIFEVRDTCTMIVAIAIALDGAEHFLLRYAGFGAGRPYVLLASVNKGYLTYNAFDHQGGRTMREAHLYILENWHTLKDGDVIDVEYIKGEKAAPAKSTQKELIEGII